MDAAQARLIPATLADAFTELRIRSHRRELRPASLTQYEMLWRGLLRDFAPLLPLEDVHARRIEEWLDKLRLTASKATVISYRNFMSMLYNVSIQKQIYFGPNPVRFTERIKKPPTRARRRLADFEVTALLQACRADQGLQARMWKTFFQVMLLTGLRVLETALLRWEDFRWQDGVFIPSHQKRSDGQDVLVITSELESVLAVWGRDGTQTGLLFPEAGAMISRHFCGRVRRVLRQYAKRAGLSDPTCIGTHALRRTYITHAAEVARGDHVALMQVARHRSFSVTRVYMPTVTKAVRDVSVATARGLGFLLGIQEDSGVAVAYGATPAAVNAEVERCNRERDESSSKEEVGQLTINFT